jgi:hypothetical protein
MTRLLGLLACVLLLAACGSDPGSAPTEPTSQPDSGFVVSDRLVSQAGAGGTVGDRATALPDAAAVERFTRGLDDALAVKVRAAAAAMPVGQGQKLFGQVVAIGCDVPPGVTVDRDPVVVVHVERVAEPKQECFAPVTTVALVVLRS